MANEVETTAERTETQQQQATSLQASLEQVLDNAKFPDANTVVTGKLSPEKITKIAEAGIEHIINLQPDSELTFDEKSAVEAAGIHYTHLPISGANDLKQINLLEFDKALRTHHGKKTLLHCGSGNRVGACIALRAGWLRGRKMDTALERGKEHGLESLEEEVRMRLLVPR
ncbi:beta-lactamase hydrolase domain-containing protein [Psychrobacter sp. UBA3962]|uniref:beta-lactamase hydrolase domain-containing protein n=1 Tax=Psychrobacter sp. UBA3962 TaxID=1947352 RepID=UPI0025E97B9F|nr:sulfur transferase domain-containing protein [Psychrobacter sp. UBA3962]